MTGSTVSSVTTIVIVELTHRVIVFVISTVKVPALTPLMLSPSMVLVRRVPLGCAVQFKE